MNLDLLAIIVLTSSLSVVSSVITLEIKRNFGYSRFVLFILHMLLLLPWLMHYCHFMVSANSDIQPWQIYLVPFCMILFVSLVVKIQYKAVKIANTLVPFFAFYTTRYYVMPTVYEANQDYVFDNIPTIWLFFWSFIATSIILTYVLPIKFLKLKK